MFKLKQLLELRHINMIALGGAVGTGIFLTSGYSIFIGGPGGALFAYIIMAVIVFFLMHSLGEMSVFRPSSGAFCDYSNIYVNSSFGFAMGYNYWLSWVVTITTEISAATIVLSYWFPNISYPLFSIIIFMIIFVFNLMSVRIYGEVEYWLALLKILVIISFIILGIYYYITHFNTLHQTSVSSHQSHHLSFHFIHNFRNGNIFNQGLLGILSALIFAGFSFQGIELIGVVSGEAKNPEKNIPHAINLAFWRLAIFYILSIAVIALLIHHNDPRLVSQNNVSISPYTLIFSNFIGKYAADLVNLIIFIALVLTANASMYTATRILWYLSKVNHAHSSLTKLSKHTIPINALVVSSICGVIFFGFSLIQHGEIFTFLVSASSLSGFIAWFGISYSHYRFRKFHLSSEAIKTLKFKAKLFPIAPIFCMLAIGVIIFSQFITLKPTIP